MSDSPLTCTGFATVSKDLINRLSLNPNYNCNYIAHNYPGQPITDVQFEDGTKLNFKLNGSGNQPYCRDILDQFISNNKLDIFGCLLDLFMVYPHFMNFNFNCKTIFYFPSDGGARLPLGCEEILKRIDLPVAMSKYAQEQARVKHNIKVEYVPHAVDSSLYFKMPDEDRKKLKSDIECLTFDMNNNISYTRLNLNNYFVVGSVFRNQSRKMADLQLKAFAQFAEGKNDVIFYMHTDPWDSAGIFNMLELIKDLKITNKVAFSGMRSYQGFDVKDMHKVYNVMDVFFLSTSGEGFGVPTIECQACGVPPVITDYTTTQELVLDNGKSGEAVPVSAEITGTWNVDRGIMDIFKGADALEKMYNNSKLRETYSKRGIEKIRKYYDWDTVVFPKWQLLFDNLANN